MSSTIRTAIAAVAAVSAALLSGCERLPMDTVQQGYRGTGMEQVNNPRLLARQAPLHVAPEAQPAVPSDGPRAGDVYKNLQLLGNLSVGEFTRLMVSMTQWVAPEQGCNYCHNPQNLAEDSVYTKVVTRKMLQMTWNINSKWQSHVAATGVTCFTCHRGNPVPLNVWSTQPRETRPQGMLGQRDGQNAPATAVGLASLPNDPFTPYLLKGDPIRVIGKTALPNGHGASIQHTEETYGLMMHISGALGVNCTFCHNTRSFGSWEGPPTRVTAYYGIRMVRDVNNAYVESLAATFPDDRKGPLGDVLKVNCGTCHQGASKPLKGVSLLKDYPELKGPPGGMAAAPAAALAATPAASAPAAASTLLGKIYFATGRTELNAEARATIAAAAQALAKDPALKIDISGFADRTGSADANLELGKQRAFAVRDALKAAGVAEGRINLRKPELVIGGAEAEARRVDLLAGK